MNQKNVFKSANEELVSCTFEINLLHPPIMQDYPDY